MKNTEIIARVQQAADTATEKANGFFGFIEPARDFILSTFGQNGLYAAYIVLAVAVLVLLSRLVKLTFATMKYLVIPAIALAFLGSLFVPMTFYALLPVTVTACSLVLLVKG